MVRKSEKNIMSLMMTLKQLRIVEVFTQILIGVGIALTISSFFILTNINQKVVFTIIGLFIWIFGLFFKVKIFIFTLSVTGTKTSNSCTKSLLA